MDTKGLQNPAKFCRIYTMGSGRSFQSSNTFWCYTIVKIKRVSSTSKRPPGIEKTSFLFSVFGKYSHCSNIFISMSKTLVKIVHSFACCQLVHTVCDRLFSSAMLFMQAEDLLKFSMIKNQSSVTSTF